MGRIALPLDRRELELDARLRTIAARHGGVVSAAQARATGAVPGDIRRLLQHHLWSRERRGVYRDVRYVSLAADPAHAARAASAIAAMSDGVVVSHLSAVRLLGLPTPPWLPDQVSLTRRPPSHGNDAAGTDVHVAAFDEDSVQMVDGIPILGGARLVVDCCQVLDGPDALAVADGVLRAKGATLGQLQAAVIERHGVPYHHGAALVVERADPGAENWFESISRWWLLEAGLPRPSLQVPLRDGLGVVRARVDMLLEEEGVVGEADGAGKYDGGPRLLFEEKRREDWIRQFHQLEVVRWVPAEMRTRKGRDGVVARWWDAIDRARGRRRHRRDA